jgi:pyruvate kinase
MDYQIIATLGPSSDRAATWQAMLAAGVTGFRLNTSHLSLPQLETWIQRLGAFLATQDPPPPLVLDLQGSKWRLGHFSACELTTGQSVTLIHADSANQPNRLPVPHGDFFRAAPLSSGEIVLNDAKVRLRIESVFVEALHARVIQGGAVAARKGVTYTASTYRQEALGETDRAVLARTGGYPDIQYALSYVKDAHEMAGYRAQIGRAAVAIAKLERPSAVDEAARIAAVADALWLCRGDLGAEVGAKAMAEAVYRLSAGVQAMPVPVLLAGQVFEHMTEHPTPTRSEVCVVYEALMKGYRGVVLSDETAIGRDPVESCRMAALFRR